MKRLLALSHAGVLDVNRAIFQSLASAARVEVTLVVPRRWKGDLIRDLEFVPSANDRHLRVIALPATVSGNGSLFFYAASLAKIAREARPDHVFIDEEPWSINAFQAFLALRDYPRSFFTKQNIHKRLPLPFRAIESWVHRESEHAYVVADEVGDVLKRKGYSKPIRFLPHSYDPELFKPLPQADRAKERRKLGIAPDAVVVSYFGRLTEEKGLRDLLEAMRLASGDPAFARTHFLYVGNGPLLEETRRAAGENARASAIEAIPHHEVGRAIACSDVLVLPSLTRPNWKEQYGRILIEAMACGSAVLGSDSGEIPNVILRTGGGLVFREGDARDLVAKLRELVSDPARLEERARAGRAYVERNLTHEAVGLWLAKDLGLQ